MRSNCSERPLDRRCTFADGGLSPRYCLAIAMAAAVAAVVVIVAAAVVAVVEIAGCLMLR